MTFLAELLVALGDEQAPPSDVPGWAGWAYLAAAGLCAIGLWRWCRNEPPRHTVTQLRRRQIAAMKEVER